MSGINTTGSSLKADYKAAAFLEACLFLDSAEKARNAANPGIAPKNNVSITFSSEEGVAQIAIQLPAAPTATGAGLVYAPTDYLGGTYAVFVPATAGTDVTAVTAMAAVSQVAHLLSAAEKAVQPVEDQPNNVQIESSSESGFINITATVPYTQSIDADGNIKIVALDYV